MAQRADVAVVGGGIVGLAFAWEAARRGQSVVLFERSPQPIGASIRNFGMIWPIGQRPGSEYQRALRSRERWLELRDKAGVWVEECGSLHVAHEDDEDAVLSEFAQIAPPLGVACNYLTRTETLARFPAVNPDGLRGALHSPTELAVNPLQAIALLPKFLVEKHQVNIRLGVAVIGVEMPIVHTAGDGDWHADRVFVCSGSDFETLFPQHYAAAGFRRCKLQMMKTPPQPGGWRIGTHVAGGLTLTHYKSFETCDTLPQLKRRVAEIMPEYVRYGIHVMASQNNCGKVLIGDSHEYDGEISPFDKPVIDNLIVTYLRKMLQLPDWTIETRWHGIYASHAARPVTMATPQPRCTIVAATGGAGMTLSFGIAREWWEENDS